MLSLIIVSMLSCHAPLDADTALIAPETLVPPIRQEFVDLNYYIRADVMYRACGNWAIKDQFAHIPQF